MPMYDFFCRACNQPFSTRLSVKELGEGKVKCPHCGSTDVEQKWVAFYAVTSRKSA